jgi:hypothetical protein
LDEKKAALLEAQDNVKKYGNDTAQISSTSYASEQATRRQYKQLLAQQAQQRLDTMNQLRWSAQAAADAAASARNSAAIQSAFRDANDTNESASSYRDINSANAAANALAAQQADQRAETTNQPTYRDFSVDTPGYTAAAV